MGAFTERGGLALGSSRGSDGSVGQGAQPLTALSDSAPVFARRRLAPLKCSQGPGEVECGELERTLNTSPGSICACRFPDRW